MNNPPSTTSSPRRARRALLTTAVAVGALAVPGTVVAGSAGPGFLSRVSAESAAPAVRFVGDTGTALSSTTRPLRSQIDTGLQGVRGLPTTTIAPAVPTLATLATPPPAPTTTVAPTTTTTVAPAPPAPAAASGAAYGDPNDPATWDRLARCEAGGNWYINTGNGYYGGLQFSASSWRGVGGTGLPHQNSREVQIEMGQRLLARGGWGQWPACSRKLGYR